MHVNVLNTANICEIKYVLNAYIDDYNLKTRFTFRVLRLLRVLILNMVAWGHGKAWSLACTPPSFSSTPGFDLHCKGPCVHSLNPSVYLLIQALSSLHHQASSTPYTEVWVNKRPGEKAYLGSRSELQADGIGNWEVGLSTLSVV